MEKLKSDSNESPAQKLTKMDASKKECIESLDHHDTEFLTSYLPEKESSVRHECCSQISAVAGSVAAKKRGRKPVYDGA